MSHKQARGAVANEVIKFGHDIAGGFPAGEIHLTDELQSDPKKLALAIERQLQQQGADVKLHFTDPTDHAPGGTIAFTFDPTQDLEQPGERVA